MIKWAKIKEDHPLAFAMFVVPLIPEKHQSKYKAFRVRQVDTVQFLELAALNLRASLPTPRMLYDFFDHCRIFVHPTYMSFEILQIDNEGKIINNIYEKGFKNRLEVETHAFIVAFGLLEAELMKDAPTEQMETPEPASPLKVVK